VIVADLTIWSAALRGQTRGFESLFNDLLLKSELTAPGAVFAQLLQEADQPGVAQRLRSWAVQVPWVEETRGSWIAVGDLAAHLAGQGNHLQLADACALTLCLREEWPLWTMNPRVDAVARSLPIKRYQPQGL
jgi:predicted nucleic acid-binding protein